MNDVGVCKVDIGRGGAHTRFDWSSITSFSSWIVLSASLLVETRDAVDNSVQPYLILRLGPTLLMST